jgi:hypothetical protein
MTQWKMKEGNTSVKKLRQALEEHSSGLTALKVDPTYDPLRAVNLASRHWSSTSD